MILDLRVRLQHVGADLASPLRLDVFTLELLDALEVLFDMDQVLGLSLRERASDADLSAEERTALAERDEARKKGDYKRSDELRAELERRYGIRVKDTKDGTRWERVRRKGA